MKIEYKENGYKLWFDMNISKINVDLIYLLLEVNKNIIESKKILCIDENKYTIQLLLKHLFKDLGIHQKYLSFDLHHDREKNCFTMNTNNNVIENIELLNINISIQYQFIKDIQYLFYVKIQNIDSIDVEEFGIEKVIGKIIIKIFNNLKEYVEGNISC
jgi:hypothetical protein